MQFAGIQPTISLYTNYYTPSLTSTLADFTGATAPGTTGQILPMPTRNGVNAFNRATWTWPAVTFAATGGGLPEVVWGYWVHCKDPWTGLPSLLWAQRLVTGFSFNNPGDSLSIPLELSIGQC